MDEIMEANPSSLVVLTKRVIVPSNRLKIIDNFTDITRLIVEVTKLENMYVTDRSIGLSPQNP